MDVPFNYGGRGKLTSAACTREESLSDMDCSSVGKIISFKIFIFGNSLEKPNVGRIYID